ncbi:FAD-dependent oxidoreductase [Amnibacterium sp. CER49]|uniref:NAD(P)/FAD-dependent oxidoreductase n=1 Tax=Amnibacterium sp. CER49 TaxID=3039161 RepID=UPI002448D428|nr:FAD-dependent oxidoreductase [Amnibacterium sp. CER49]MDH2443330.1 FAD-dependent oxidoreductase [Amnibacterium sp. CER49]
MSNDVDIAIIGGGVVGLSIAYELATRTDLSIALFDKEGPGNGTSGRSAGVICRHDQGPIYQRLSLVGHARMRRFAADHGFRFSTWGSLSIIREPDVFPPTSDVPPELAAAPSGMYVSELLGRDELLERFPWVAPDGVLGGVFEPNVGFINPYELIDLYRRLLAELPTVSVDYGNPVLELRTDGGRVTEVATRRGLWRAGTVINASGAWANKVSALAGTSVHITPQRMNVVLATGYDDAVGEVPLHGAPEMQWEGDGVWCRGEIGGAVLFGQHRDKTRPEKPTADPDFFDKLPDAGFAPSLAPQLERYYRLPRSRVLDGWTCVYDTSDDGFPILGRDARVTNLVHAVGMNGHGMTIHAGVARCIAALVVDGSSSIDISDVLPSERELDFAILRPGRFDEGEALRLRGESGGHGAAAEQEVGGGA